MFVIGKCKGCGSSFGHVEGCPNSLDHMKVDAVLKGISLPQREEQREEFYSEIVELLTDDDDTLAFQIFDVVDCTEIENVVVELSNLLKDEN